ncbi:MAG: hypothetical protein H5T63_02940, partial [Chloroflexi bacterium]|nr:hypothetical protein [Chloroflexota bacterium]
EEVRAAGEVTAKSLPVGVAPLGAGEGLTGTLAAERALPKPEPPTPSPTAAPTSTVRVVEPATPTSKPMEPVAAYGLRPEATPTPSYAGSSQVVGRALDGAMWALLVAMVVLWAGTAILRPRR